MVAVNANEVRPGLSAFLDDRVLAQCPGCRSNARTSANLVNRPGPFLVLAMMPDDAWLCVPLISNPGASRLALDQTLKSGPGNGWRERMSYYSLHQFWVIPTPCLLSASAGEFSPVGNRQRYADEHSEALSKIIHHQFDSDSPYRLVADL
jgi:hypothetical protein